MTNILNKKNILILIIILAVIVIYLYNVLINKPKINNTNNIINKEKREQTITNNNNNKINSTTTTISNVKENVNNKQNNNVNNKVAIEDKKSYNLRKVAQHNTQNDCWTIIGDKVYDITNFIPNHPGGDVIANMCGVDGTEMFNNKHEGQSKPRRVLEKLLLGFYER